MSPSTNLGPESPTLAPTAPRSPSSGNGSEAQTGITLDQPKRFCPYGGIVGSRESQWNMRTARLLHGRLKALGALAVVSSLIWQVRDALITTGVSLTFPRIILAILTVAVIYLWVEKNPPLIKLRVFEAFVFLGSIASLLYIDWQLVLDAARAGDGGVMLMNWYRLCLHMGLTIAAYTVFIPAGWKRTLVAMTPVALVPMVFGFVMLQVYPEVAAAAQAAATTEIVTGGILTMVVFLAVAVYGTYVIDAVRHQAANAGYAGQYTLEKKLGTGGMGEVWLARHSMLTRPAAIKVIRPEVLADDAHKAEEIPTIMKRFEREAQATASLTSPHTVDLYDFGTTMDGSFYYVMQFLNGLDLDTLIEDHGPVPVERAVHLLTQAAESLADAHDNGLIHRDVKPANIFTTRMGTRHDFVKVLDFGLVKETKNDMEATQLTQQGMTSGTPAYMPPEIALAKKDVDARADIYALGCVGYRLTTGQYVFDSESPMAMVVDHVKSEPVAPSKRTELPISPEFDEVILRALSKDPADRYQSMREFAEALAGIPAAEEWTEETAAGWWKLHELGTAVHQGPTLATAH